MRFLRLALAAGLTGALTWVSGPAVAASTVTASGQSHTLDGTNIYRSANFLVEYTPAFGASTQTNPYGYEAAVVNCTVTTAQDGVGNMAIPSSGYVLSGHGTSRTWLKANAPVGATVSLPGDGCTGGGGGGGNPLLPDVGVRTLRQFTISTPTSGALAGHKLLKFPGVTANVGAGPLEIHGHRSSSTSTDWVATQTVYNDDGSKTVLPPNGETFYFAGDGHNHWHLKDFDAYQLFNSAGTKLKEGEKHGFCFEDNTSYRDWPGSSKHPASPANPVYTPSTVCGVNQPNATDIMHGLSVGWGDTYPASLPDQAIDITGIPDGKYMVKVTADVSNFIKESNETNNSATAQIQISGNTVTLLSATDGL